MSRLSYTCKCKQNKCLLYGACILYSYLCIFFYLSENFYKIWKDFFQHFLAMTLSVMCFTVFTEKLEETPSELLFLFTYLMSDIGLIFYKRKLECLSVIRKIDTILLLLYLALLWCYFILKSNGRKLYFIVFYANILIKVRPL